MYNQKPLPGDLLDYGCPLSNGLIGCWLFNEGSGNKVLDMSGNGNDGTLQGTARYTVCKYGSGLDLDGNSDYADCGNNTTLDVSDGFTILVWVYKKAVGNNTIFGKQNNVGNDAGYYFRINGPSGFRNTSESWEEITVPDISLNIWHQVALTYDGANLAFYLDGVLNVTGAATGTVKAITAKASIGRLGDYDGQYWNGLIDHVLLCNCPSSASEIALLYSEPFCMVGERRRIIYDGIAAVSSIPLFVHHYKMLKAS